MFFCIRISIAVLSALFATTEHSAADRQIYYYADPAYNNGGAHRDTLFFKKIPGVHVYRYSSSSSSMLVAGKEFATNTMEENLSLICQ